MITLDKGRVTDLILVSGNKHRCKLLKRDYRLKSIIEFTFTCIFLYLLIKSDGRTDELTN